jgi:hypothetical protein
MKTSQKIALAALAGLGAILFAYKAVLFSYMLFFMFIMSDSHIAD